MSSHLATGRQLLAALLRIYLLWIAVFVAGRLALLAWVWERMSALPPQSRWTAMLHGWRMDTIALSAMLLAPLLLLTLSPRPFAGFASRTLRAVVILGFLLILLVELAGFPFFAEYDSRPNILFVQYLEYPQEVFSTIWKSQKAELLVIATALLAATWVLRRAKTLADFSGVLGIETRSRALWMLPLLVILVLGFRSSLGHRPANISDALYSTDRIANEVAKNSLYSVAYDSYLARDDEMRMAGRYGRIPEGESYSRVRNLLGISGDDVQRPLARAVEALARSPEPRNLVVIVEESLGARFAGFTGGEPGLTPHFDALARQGIAFTRLYSTGTRSIQGLAAVTSGFLAPPGEGILERARSQNNFFTIAHLLEEFGYRSAFIYGGEARFDNMRAWYLGNGFDEVIEEEDYENPGFVSSWGVSDEDLFLKANERFRQLAASGSPFVSVVFTSSNHEPFELPEGKIEWVPGEARQSVRNAIRYADFALGKFFRLAAGEEYFRNTVFLVIADHDVRVYGDGVFPVESFRIPAVIYAQGIAPQVYDEVASQPDALATALHLLGLDMEYPILGNSIFNPGRQAFVMMRFNDHYALLRGDRLALLRPDQAATTWRYSDGTLTPAPPSDELQRDAMALVHVAEDLYHDRRYTPRGAAPEHGGDGGLPPAAPAVSAAGFPDAGGR